MSPCPFPGHPHTKHLLPLCQCDISFQFFVFARLLQLRGAGRHKNNNKKSVSISTGGCSAQRTTSAREKEQTTEKKKNTAVTQVQCNAVKTVRMLFPASYELHLPLSQRSASQG
jgi:hypothetical protein